MCVYFKPYVVISGVNIHGTSVHHLRSFWLFNIFLLLVGFSFFCVNFLQLTLISPVRLCFCISLFVGLSVCWQNYSISTPLRVGLPTGLSSGWPCASHGPKSKIPLPRSLFHKSVEYTCQVSSTSAQRFRSLRVLKSVDTARTEIWLVLIVSSGETNKKLWINFVKFWEWVCLGV